MKKFNTLAISDPEGLVFGRSTYPVTTRRGLVIGDGNVYPELNFTLPEIEISETTLPTIVTMYQSIVDEACKRACELQCPGLVIEFETLIEMTLNPHFALRITETINSVLDKYHENHGLKSALRLTPNDTRDKKRPPSMRSGPLLENMLKTFSLCANAGAELLSIESTGGKEIHDDALISCDIAKALFALGIMGVRDMSFLWERIIPIAEDVGTVAAGDTACGFGNTAMVLAERKFIPRVFAAVIRAMTIPRSLVAYEMGAVGPGKDCGYENPFIKAITGYPMAMEGKSAACAHTSPLGNIAAATCDLWSNESVQNIKLLGGMAPTVSLEQLAYDCRLMNTATKKKQMVTLRNLMVESDTYHDPQALILSPENVILISDTILNRTNHYTMTKYAAIKALEIIEKAHNDGLCVIPENEVSWISMLGDLLSSLPDQTETFIEQTIPLLDAKKFRPEDYELRLKNQATAV
ncbi:MAG: methanol--corrinoid methyltransferase [Chitinivibrionales bacterium]|nr:methanol--corrinoid methyltransferase [Chitinivibrionales bacterium]